MVYNHTGGTVVQDEIFYPWGERWAYGGAFYDERFASLGRRDAESTLDPTLFRMYESRLYRWLSPDPLAGDTLNPQSLNRYAYVVNSPTNFIDPLGSDCTTYVTRDFFPGNPPGTYYSSETVCDPISQLPLDRSMLQWNRTISIYIQLERAMASLRERRNALTPERIAALGLGPHVEQKDPEQAYKQCMSDFKATTVGKVVKFGSLLSFYDDPWGTAKSWAGVILVKGTILGAAELGGQSAANSAEITTLTSVRAAETSPVVKGARSLKYAGAVGIGVATLADLNARSTCTAVAHGWPVYEGNP